MNFLSKTLRRHGLRSTLLLLTGLLFQPALMGKTSYQFYRFTVFKTRGNINACQLSEFGLVKDFEDLEISSVTNPGGTSPANEGPANLIDGMTATKWYTGSYFPLVFTLPAPVAVDGYYFATANDADTRDPVSWTLEGSTDETNWDLLASVSDFPTPTTRNTFIEDQPVPSAPDITDFYVDGNQINTNGQTVLVGYDVVLADTVSLLPTPGVLPFNDFDDFDVVLPSDADTVFTLEATNGAGTVTASSQVVRSVEQGSATFPYIRFTPVRLRGDLPGQSFSSLIQVTEFLFFNGGSEVSPIGATNPAGSSPATEGIANLIDGNLTNKWLDFNRSAVIFEFGEGVSVDSYQFITANDFPTRDPVAWLLEGSTDQTEWTLIDSVLTVRGSPSTNFNYIPPTNRFTASQVFPIPAVAPTDPALITSFEVFPEIVTNGTPVEFSWESSFGTMWSIDGAGSISGDTGTTTVTPPDDSETEYTLTVDNSLNSPVEKTVTVRTVEQGSATYAMVRFTTLRIASGLEGYGFAEYVQLSEFDFYNGGTPVDMTTATFTNPGGTSLTGEGVTNLRDNNVNTKWLDLNIAPVVMTFASPVTFDGYGWSTANDIPERDPVAWVLEGSSDGGTTWNVIDRVDRSLANPAEEIHFYDGYPRLTSIGIIPVPAGLVVPDTSLRIIGAEFDFTPGSETLVLIWSSAPDVLYNITGAINLEDGFTESIASFVPGATGASQTTFTIPVISGGARFFRVELAP